MHPLHDVPEDASEDGSSAGGTTARSGPSLEDLISRAQQEQRHLAEENAALQRRARAVLDERAKGRPQVAKDLAHLDGAEARYRCVWGAAF